MASIYFILVSFSTLKEVARCCIQRARCALSYGVTDTGRADAESALNDWEYQLEVTTRAISVSLTTSLEGFQVLKLQLDARQVTSCIYFMYSLVPLNQPADFPVAPSSGIIYLALRV